MVNGQRQAAPLRSQGGLPWPARYARPVLAAVLVIVVLAGVRAARPAVAGTGPWHQDVLPLAGAFEFVLALLLVALWFISRRRPNPGYLAGALRAGLRRVIPLGMITVAILAGLSRLHLHPGRGVRTARRGLPRPLVPRIVPGAAAHNSATVTYIGYALLALLLLAAIVACIVVFLRLVPPGSPRESLMPPGDDDASMREAIDSGRRALRSFDDAQAAIIACYVAMEASLASAGTTRTAAETPDELLARAAGSGILQGTAAGRLTALFYEARYSSHAVPATAKDEAVRALDAISAELARRADSSTLSSPPAPGAAP